MNSSGLYKTKKEVSSTFFNKNLILFPINIFKASDLNYTQKTLLSLCFLYRNSENLIDIETLAFKWNNQNGYKIQRKLMNHLKALEDKGYCTILYQYLRPIRVILKSHPIFVSQHVGLKKSLVYSHNYSFDETLLYLYYMSQTINWCNHSTTIAFMLGLHRTTVQKYSAQLEKRGLICRVTNNNNMFKGKKEKYSIGIENACDFITRNNFVHKAVDARVPKPTLLKYNKIIFKDKVFFKRKHIHQSLLNRYRRVKELKQIQNLVMMYDESISLKEFLADDRHLEKVQQAVKREKDQTYDTNFIRWLAKKIRLRTYADISFYTEKLVKSLLKELRSGEDTWRWDVNYAC